MIRRRRKVSDKGLRFIGRFEGFVPHAYKPVASETYYTIGYGHYGPDVRAGDVISKKDALALLRKDARLAEKFVRDQVKVPLTQTQYDALVSFVFNVGGGAFCDSTLLELLNQRKYRAVPDQLAKWVNGNDGPLPGLVTRREAEGLLWSRGVYH